MSTPPRKKVSSKNAKPTLSLVAKSAGVSLVTASYAMRNNPKISVATREKVHRAAKALGYAPNPEIGRLMYLIRSGRNVSEKSTMAVLTFDHEPTPDPSQYLATWVAGVEERSRELGYSIDHIKVDPSKMTGARVTQILNSRGIKGVLIPPLRRVTDCAALLDWSQFSVVAATYTAQNIAVNRVVPNHLQTGLLAVDTLEAKGFRRVGLVTEVGDHHRVSYSFLAVLAMHQQEGRLAPIPALVCDEHTDLKSWREQFDPDVILATELRLVPVLTKGLGWEQGADIPIYLLNNPGDGLFGGAYQHPEIVGKIAVDLLASQIQRGERGFTEHPNIMMVEGSWIEAKTLALGAAVAQV